MNREPPQAELTYQQNKITRVICPYCKKEHRHIVYRHGIPSFSTAEFPQSPQAPLGQPQPSCHIENMVRLSRNKCRRVDERPRITQRFTPHCGQHLTPEQRITGYTFTTKPPQKGKTERKNQ